ncbi:MAG: GNAT family N-acetyltransferase [Myxococcales bacterium]|nr:GNAT family N-acetyltransferase [Myxococcales bacterium]
MGGKKVVEIASLFDERSTFRAAIDAVLEERCGSIVAGRGCARLDLCPFSILAGDATAPDARSLVADITIPRIFVDGSEWHASIRERHTACALDLVRRTRFSADELDEEHLRALRRVPGEMRILPLDAASLHEAVTQLSSDLLIEAVSRDAEAFVSAGGFGFAVVQGEHFLAAATSAIVSDRHIEIQINTAAEHRRQGLATAVGAAIVLESRIRGLEPGWDTASPASAALARKLGFRAAREYEWLCVDS